MYPQTAQNGVLLLDKGKGKTSFSAMNEAKRLFGAKKAGHSGTLDKAASGLLVICTGSMTRLTQYFLEGDKRYTGLIKLGVTTDTCDAEGEVLATAALNGIDEDRIRFAAEGFKGRIRQRPPVYSALKIRGRRASDLVREGREVSLNEREVIVKELNVLDVDLFSGTISIDVLCSKGTYIRSLARDIGEHLGTGAHLTDLRRTASGRFLVEDAATIGEMRGVLSGLHMDKRFLLTPEQALVDFGRVVVAEEAVKKVANGAFFRETDMVSMKGRSPFLILDGRKNCIAIANIDINNWSVEYDMVFNR